MSDSNETTEEVTGDNLESTEESEKKRIKLANNEESVEIGPSLPTTLQTRECTSDKRKVTPLVMHNLSWLPSSRIYEKSYMHRDTVCRVRFACKTDFLITASKDGHVKFWKKRDTYIEFVKDFLAHQGECLFYNFAVSP